MAALRAALAMKRSSSFLAAAATAALLHAAAAAHGGVYRGPVPYTPSPAPGGPRAPGPGGPGGPAAPAAATAGARLPVGRPLAAASTASGEVAVDLTRWQFWWEFNKDSYLNLKRAVHRPQQAGARDESLRPTPAQVDGQIRPALLRALGEVRQRDVVTACLIALAKLGEARPPAALPEMRARLARDDQEIRETAALALGITGCPEAMDDLIALVLDGERGRRLCERANVDGRTRAFAAYGLGLLAHGLDDVESKARVLEALRPLLEGAAPETRDLRAAAVHAIRLARPDPAERSRPAWKLAADAADALWAYASRDGTRGEELAQAHAPVAIAHVLGRGGDQTDRFTTAFIAMLEADRERHPAFAQSAALALGQLAPLGDRRVVEALARHCRSGRDPQARYFSMIALGQIGGDAARAALLTAFLRGQKATVRPWAALALGLHARGQRAAGTGPDRELLRALRTGIDGAKNEDAIGATAVAIGLAGDREAIGPLRSLLRRYASRDEVAGYLCVGLALLDAREAAPELLDLAARSTRRPALLKHVAVALGRVGAKEAAALLRQMLMGERPNVAELFAVAGALSQIGDRTSIDPLMLWLADDGSPDLSRASAAAALGGIGDRATLPWSAALAADVNYRAALPTLTDGSSGVLDIF
jgi:HEAT repeat protein